MGPTASTLPNVEAFCRTFEAGSFTRAARLLGVTPQATSRSVARLEAALGVTLFRRTTRSLAPTDEARRYYERCARALAALADGEREIASGRGEVRGRVRVSAPTTWGHHRLVPSLGAFRERFPGVEVDVEIANHVVDFVQGGHHLAIRMGTIRDRTLVARKLGDYPLGVFASPSYVARRGAPKTPDDLADHDCVVFLMPRTGRPLPWSFEPGPAASTPTAAVRAADDPLAAIGLARAGLGLVQTYDFLVEDDVARGLLVPVLAAFRGASRPFSVVHPKGTILSGAARALRAFLVERASAGR